MARWRRLSKVVLAIPPPAFLGLGYAGLILIGALALRLPLAQAQPFGWSDALFTAASSVTVTGLGVISAAEALTPAGQGILLVLIQLGGLGLMTVSVLVLSALGLPVGLTQHRYLREDLNQTSIGPLLGLTRAILRVVLVCEAVGALLLAPAFVPSLGLGPGLWHAVFHAVSAFNNAGVSSLPQGLRPWVADPVVNLVVPALVILGGLGYGVLMEVVRLRRWRRLSLHAKLMLSGTAVLLVLSVGLIAGLEWTNPRTIGGLELAGKLLASWFQAVTPRSAGFDTLDMAGLRDSTAVLFLALMFIGGGPTSTASGVKVTTVLVLLLATVAFFRRQTELSAFGRSIGLEEVLKVAALTAISVSVVFGGVFLLSITHPGRFLDLAFEVTSAFGTAGLTRGITAELGDYGRVLMIVLMFLGRVGPLTLGFFIATQTSPRVRYPAGQVLIG